ncbi:MAG: hypothetical protein HZB80_07850 [Deltaproteobacteria bacterium]|nr:hypothetical protein [Deltaproteobacteria bacterium]
MPAHTNNNTSTWDNFHNPYHFVPAKQSGRIDDLCLTAFDDRQLNHVTHDLYVDNTHSGRVICRLTAKSPFFVGDERTKEASEEAPAEVSNFEIDGKPAIPASSLRGLISNIAEAASNSAMRVMENRYYSYRVNMRKGLGSLGMIIKNDDGYYRLRPLSLPSLSWNDTRNEATVAPKYNKMFTTGLLKVYIDGYRKKTEYKSYRNGNKSRFFSCRPKPKIL